MHTMSLYHVIPLHNGAYAANIHISFLHVRVLPLAHTTANSAEIVHWVLLRASALLAREGGLQLMQAHQWVYVCVPWLAQGSSQLLPWGERNLHESQQSGWSCGCGHPVMVPHHRLDSEGPLGYMGRGEGRKEKGGESDTEKKGLYSASPVEVEDAKRSSYFVFPPSPTVLKTRVLYASRPYTVAE